MKKKKWLLPAMGLLFLAGLGLLLYPALYGARCEAREAWQIAIYTEERAAVPEDTLKNALETYNEELFVKGQKDLTSLAACAAFAVDPENFGRGEMVGHVDIPALQIDLPLYLGASDDHMARGAAVMGETSAPVGGASTNCVIAGHRGWRGADKFRYLDRLQPGDMVYVTNDWETLAYAVEEIQIIQPDDVGAVAIRPGEDLVTLLTCHPYASGGKYRYLVICRRVETP